MVKIQPVISENKSCDPQEKAKKLHLSAILVQNVLEIRYVSKKFFWANPLHVRSCLPRLWCKKFNRTFWKESNLVIKINPKIMQILIHSAYPVCVARSPKATNDIALSFYKLWKCRRNVGLWFLRNAEFLLQKKNRSLPKFGYSRLWKFARKDNFRKRYHSAKFCK